MDAIVRGLPNPVLLPVPVVVIATHSCYARECRADGVLFSGGRFVIDYPFQWVGRDKLSFPEASGNAPLNITGLLQADGKPLGGGWTDIGLGDLTEQEAQALQARITSLHTTPLAPYLVDKVYSQVKLFQRVADGAIRAHSNTLTEAQ